MTKHIIDSKTTGGLNLNANGDTWIITRYGSVNSYNGAAIHDQGQGSTFKIDGFVAGASGGILAMGWKVDIQIGAHGVLYGGNSDAISLEGTDASVFNRGKIYGFVTAWDDNAHIENYGFIAGGMILNGSGTLINHKSGVIQATNSHMRADSGAGDHVRIVNDGSILGVEPGAYVIDGGGGQEVVINRHAISGAVGLGGGNDRFTSHGVVIQGTVGGDDGNDRIDVRNCNLKAFGEGYGGAVYGGAGNDTLDLRGTKLALGAYGGADDDTYIIDHRSIPIQESPDFGIDTVKSYVSFTLGGNFENLVLMAGKKLNGTGNGLDNVLTGNIGNNILKGKGGADLLDGGKGNDKLFGGAGADTFGFATGYGKDAIGDFDRSEGDSIYVRNWKAIEDFHDLKSHASNHGADVWITAGHDTLIVDNMHKADLNAGDFQF